MLHSSVLGAAALVAFGVAAGAISLPAFASFDTIAQLELTGYDPLAVPTVGKDGAFYGTTSYGGAMNHGTIYRVSANGVVTTLADLDTSIGLSPKGELVQGPDGSWYGTAVYGGDANLGTIFKLTPAGQLIRLHSFSGLDGAYPLAGLCFGADGALYGVTSSGGITNHGELFKITTDGSLTGLHSFDEALLGGYPSYTLTLAPDGSLYGTTNGGGSSGYGTVFKYTTDGQFSQVVSMTDAIAEPSSPLTIGPDGNFYGTTAKGSTRKTLNGTIYKVTPSGTLTMIAGFLYPTKASRYGGGPAGRLALGPDGNFYGITTNNLLYSQGRDAELYRVTPSGALTKLKAFWYEQGYVAAIPGVVFGPDGAIYGGITAGGSTGGGELYRMTLDGSYSDFADFAQCSLGCGMSSVPTLGADGALYGMTDSATLYRVSGGAYQAIATFTEAQVTKPSKLTLGLDGNLYGVGEHGGKSGNGSVFRVTATGKITTLASFDYTNGTIPDAPPVFGPDGALYGGTLGGGTSYGGVLYKLSNPTASSSASMVLTVLDNLSTATGTGIIEPLTLAADGNFYGTTLWGGASDFGIVFRLTPSGVMTTLGSTNLTFSPLKSGPDGALYGLSQAGGSADEGTIFRVGLDGSVQTLFSFDGITTGGVPNGDFVISGTGILYGVTESGGSGTGLVFQFDLSSQTFTVLDVYPFTVNPKLNGLTQTIDGQFYATAGVIDAQSLGYGALYRWVP